MDLKSYHADKRLRLEIQDWYSLAGDIACDGKLSTEAQIRFCEITTKLVLIADEQDPPIDPKSLEKLASLDPAALPGVASRYALSDAACLTWRRIRAARWRTRPTAAVITKKNRGEETPMKIIGFFTAALTKGERLRNAQIADLVGCSPAYVGQVLKRYKLTTSADDLSDAKDRYPDHNPDPINLRASDRLYTKNGSSVYKSKKSSH
jgi:hypothetical protein